MTLGSGLNGLEKNPCQNVTAITSARYCTRWILSNARRLIAHGLVPSERREAASQSMKLTMLLVLSRMTYSYIVIIVNTKSRGSRSRTTYIQGINLYMDNGEWKLVAPAGSFVSSFDFSRYTVPGNEGEERLLGASSAHQRNDARKL